MKQDIELAVDNPSRLSPMNTREQALLATYDFLKHMSTLAIVAVGGMLGLAQGVGAKIAGPILVSIALVGTSAFLSLVFMAAVLPQGRGRLARGQGTVDPADGIEHFQNIS